MSQTKAARKSFIPSAYFIFEDLLLWRVRLEWLLFRLRHLSSTKTSERRPRLALLVPFYALKGAELRPWFLLARDKLRTLLRRAPTWAEGHLLLASAEARLIEINEKLDARGIRAVELQVEAFLTLRKLLKAEELQACSTVSREVGIAFTLQAWAKQLVGDLEGALAGFERVLSLPGRGTPRGRERADVCEAAARIALTIGREEIARNLLQSVPEQWRSAEIVQLLNQLSGIVDKGRAAYSIDRSAEVSSGDATKRSPSASADGGG